MIGQGGGSFGGAPGTAAFGGLIAVLWRGKWFAFACAVTCAALAGAALVRVPPVFDASAMIVLDTRSERITDIDAVVGSLNVDNAVTASEIAIIRSDSVVGEVVATLDLAAHPYFSPASPGPAQALLAELRRLTAPYVPWPAPSAPTRPPDVHQRLTEAMTVSQVGRSYVIAITVRTTDAELSARTANALAETYIARQVQAKRAATSRASGWLSERITALKTEVADADAAIEAFKAGQAFGDGQGAIVTGQQLSAVNAELISARAARAEAEARRDQVALLMAAKGRSAAADVLSSPLILSLRREQADARRREAELASRYGPKHPKMTNVKAELRDIGATISGEVAKIIAGLDNDLAVALAREKTLETELSGLEDRSVDLSRASVGLRQLEREADASRRIYETFLDRWKETTEAADMGLADARIISRARAADQPAAPRKGAITVIAGLGGGMLGFAFLFLGEAMSNTFRTAAEAERGLGASVIAKLPKLRRARRRRSILDGLSAAPNSAFAEAVRGLRNALLLTDAARPPKIVMITSAAPGEGKTTTSLALAHMGAAFGRKTVVVECDFRRPSLAVAVGARPAPGRDLAAALSGECEPLDAVIPFGPDGAHILPLGAPSPARADALGSDRFRDILAELGRAFDLVILDTPPAMAVADAGLVGRAADAAVLVVRWNATPGQAAAECVKRLGEAGTPLSGVVLTMVDPRREARYEYAGCRTGPPDYSPYYA